jgi:hypothetical protein
LIECFHNGVELEEHLAIVEAQDTQTQLIEIGRTAPIAIRLSWFQMVCAVDLYDQPRSRRIEINDVVADGLLSVKLRSKELLSTYAPPEPRSASVTFARNRRAIPLK